jgi:two-component system chemotaxis sensor kinase CheA
MVEMDDQDVVREFLIESNENLARLDNEIVELERRPKDADLLASIFRTFHTIKGTCGFLGFTALEAITHEAETILSQLRSGERELSGSITSLMLEVVDATRSILAFIEKDGQEGPNGHLDLRKRLKQAADAVEAAAAAGRGGHAAPGQRRAGQRRRRAPPLGRRFRHPRRRWSPRQADESGGRVGPGPQPDPPAHHPERRRLAERHFAAIEPDHDRIAGRRHEDPNAADRRGLEQTAARGAGHLLLALGKQIRLEMDGAETELDKTIIEAIKDPLTHLVRNSCDHGIERPEARVQAGKPAQGKVLLRAYHEGGQVNIEICDDGAGIDIARLKKKAVAKGGLRAEQAERSGDREALNLIFHPGLSTADSVTNVSGRGVGMDVVQSNIEKIGGLVDVSSRVGEGTTVRLKIPLTLAIIPGLVVTSGGERFVIPQVSLLELIRLEGDAGGKQIERVHGTPVYRRRGSLLPIAHLNEVLRLRGPRSTEAVSIVVLQGEDRQFGLVVDGISDTQEIVVKPLGKQLKGLTTYAGATIMGDGKVALILDVVGIGQRSGVLAAAEQSRADARHKGQAASDAQRLLLFRAGSFERIAVPLSLVARLEEFHQTAIEHAGGRRVVQYRDRILPLVSLTTILEPGAADTAAAQDPIQAIVFKDGEHSIGIVVDKVLDIIEDEVVIRQQTAHQGLLGSAVVGKRVADFLDLHAVLKAVAGDWFRRRPAGRHPATVLLAEASPFARGLLRGGLEMAGHRVIEASNAPEVLTILDRGGADVLVASLDLPPEGGFALLEAVRRRSGAKPLPALALTAAAPETTRPDREPAFEDYQPKFDCEAMVRSVERLAAAVADAGAVPAGIGESR